MGPFGIYIKYSEYLEMLRIRANQLIPQKAITWLFVFYRVYSNLPEISFVDLLKF